MIIRVDNYLGEIRCSPDERVRLFRVRQSGEFIIETGDGAQIHEYDAVLLADVRAVRSEDGKVVFEGYLAEGVTIDV